MHFYTMQQAQEKRSLQLAMPRNLKNSFPGPHSGACHSSKKVHLSVSGLKNKLVCMWLNIAAYTFWLYMIESRLVNDSSKSPVPLS